VVLMLRSKPDKLSLPVAGSYLDGEKQKASS